jgi:microcin C transport system substrate-binding protein
VNPDAPQGGEMSLSWSSAGGSFDSLHPYTNQGNPAVLSSIFFESMLEGTLTRSARPTACCARRIAYPEDRSYVIFTLREEARFSDGTPVTAQDVLFSYEILRDEGSAVLPREPPQHHRGRRGAGRAAHPLRLQPRQPAVAAGSRRRAACRSSARRAISQRPRFRRKPAGAADRVRSLRAGRDRSGPLHSLRAQPRLLGQRPADQSRAAQFRPIRVEYYADAIAAFEGFTAGNYLFRQENSSQNWANNYDFPRLKQGIVIRRKSPRA